MFKRNFWMKPVFILVLSAQLSGLCAQEAATGQQQVFTGVYLMNLYDLNVNEYSFYADFYIWFRWKGDRDPSGIEFVNSVEKWGFTTEMFSEEPKELAGGWMYNGMRIEGRFYYPFALNRFPLDKHELVIQLENTDYPIDSLIYLPDTSRFLMREDFVIPGWEVEKAETASHTNAYSTDFGEPTGARSAYSNFTFLIHLKRPLSYFALKLMLPLLVVILASLGALFIYPSYIDARISLPIGGLLSCVFLQQSYSSALPDVGYMVLMDQIYLLSYLLIAAVILNVMLSGNKAATKDGMNFKGLYNNNKRLAIYLFTGYFLGIALLIFL